MTDRTIVDAIKQRAVSICFMALFALLVFIYLPVFFNAPRSDWWESLYFFHSIYSSAQPYQWLHLFNTDVYGHVTFRPLSHMVLFLQHLIFGSRFIYMHIINFFLYSASLTLLYRLARLLGNDRGLSVAFIGFFAFLFSHFDTVSWTAHSYVILGFCLFLSGFVLYARFLKTGKGVFLFLVAVLFLTGMLCYEAFIFWPLSVIILNYFPNPVGRERTSGKRLIKSCLGLIGSVYILYAGIFFLTRLIPTYEDSWTQTLALVSQLSSMRRILETVFAVFFNILYNGIFVNINPLIATPLRFDCVSSNLRMGGFLSAYRPTILGMQIATVFVTAAILWGVVYLVRRRRLDVLKKFAFLLFLLFSFSFALFHCKYFSNKEYYYNFQQFRFQYIPNAFIMLIALLFFNKLTEAASARKTKMVIYLILFVLTASNISHVIASVSLERRQMAPLNRMLDSVRKGIESGRINERDRVYIADDIVDLLPQMCWNPEMGRLFMEGTYQWMFAKDEIRYFEDRSEQAVWAIDKKSFTIKRSKTP